MPIQAQNINGTSENVCKCGSWLDHWAKFSSGTPGRCSALNCDANAQVGAHVQIYLKSGWHIVPLCTSHNLQTRMLMLKDGTKIASANVRETCGKN